MLTNKLLFCLPLVAVAACSGPSSTLSSSNASAAISGLSGADLAKYAGVMSAHNKAFTAAAEAVGSMAPVDFYDMVTTYLDDAPFTLGSTKVSNMHATMLANRPNFLTAASKFTSAGDMLGLTTIDFSHAPSAADLTAALDQTAKALPHSTNLGLDDGTDSNEDESNTAVAVTGGNPEFKSSTCKGGAVFSAAVTSVAAPSKFAVGAYCLGAFGVHAGADAIKESAARLGRGAVGGEVGLTEALLSEGVQAVEQAGVTAYNWIKGGAHCAGGVVTAAAPAAISEGFNQFCAEAGKPK